MQACIVVERRFWLSFSIGGAVGEDGTSYFFFYCCPLKLFYCSKLGLISGEVMDYGQISSGRQKAHSAFLPPVDECIGF